MANQNGFPGAFFPRNGARISLFQDAPREVDTTVERCKVCGRFVNDHEKHCPRGLVSPPESVPEKE